MSIQQKRFSPKLYFHGDYNELINGCKSPDKKILQKIKKVFVYLKKNFSIFLFFLLVQSIREKTLCE